MTPVPWIFILSYPDVLLLKNGSISFMSLTEMDEQPMDIAEITVRRIKIFKKFI